MMFSTILLNALQGAPNQELLNIGYKLALIGMSTVFIGLVILSLSLPLIKRIAEGKKNKKKDSDSTDDSCELTADQIVAITTAIHAHILKINQMEDMKLTWEMYERPYTPWRLAGRSKMLMDRTPTRQRKRSW